MALCIRGLGVTQTRAKKLLAKNMMIYIHEINHNTQHRGKVCDHEGANRLEELVESLCSAKGISVVAEEFSEEACQFNKVEASVCHHVVNRLGSPLLHIYCDPNSSERECLGIPSQAEIDERVKEKLGVKYIRKEDIDCCNRLAAKYHPIREEFWLTKLKPHKGTNVAFICGSDHIDSFAAMLTKNDWEVETF